jgi:hypothetical protein
VLALHYLRVERLRRLKYGEETVTPWNEAKQRIRAQTKAG